MEEKERLLSLLTRISPEEINKIIESNGKEPKLVSPFIKVKN